MTRGYVVIIKNGKIVKVAYSNSDSYFSNLGLDVLKAFQTRNDFGFEKLIDKMNDYENYQKDIEGFDFCWYNKTKLSQENDFYCDYTYEYNITKDTVTIYYYGKKNITITEDNFKLAEYVFNNNQKVSFALQFDEESLTCSEKYFKELTKYFKSNISIEDFEKIIEEKYNKTNWYLSSYKCIDVWKDSYKKTLYHKDNKSKLEFVISKNSYANKKEYRIYICTPFIRLSFNNNIFTSEKKLMENLVRQIKANDNKLLETYKCFKLYEKYYDKFKTIISSETITEEILNNWFTQFKIELQSIDFNQTISIITEEKIISYMRQNFQVAYKKLNEVV